MPLTLGIFIDSTESQKDQHAEHRQTAIELLQRILRPGDQFFVISVDQEIRSWADLTKASAGLRVQIPDRLGPPLGDPCTKHEQNTCASSPLWDAVYSSSRLTLRSVTGSKALLLLSSRRGGEPRGCVCVRHSVSKRLRPQLCTRPLPPRRRGGRYLVPRTRWPIRSDHLPPRNRPAPPLCRRISTGPSQRQGSTRHPH